MHMFNVLCFLIFLFLGVYAYLTSNENSNFSRHPYMQLWRDVLRFDIKLLSREVVHAGN